MGDVLVVRNTSIAVGAAALPFAFCDLPFGLLFQLQKRASQKAKRKG
jgi:hypothetical protein